MNTRINKFIFLTGFMAAGKTSVGKYLAAILQSPFYDSDEIIIRKTGMEIAKIFGEYGEEYFREIEKEVILELKADPPGVVALGGGAVVNDWCIPFLKSLGKMIFLKISPDTVTHRIHDNSRPLLTPREKTSWINKINELYKLRLPFYTQADIVIEADNKDVDEIANEIVTQLKGNPPNIQ